MVLQLRTSFHGRENIELTNDLLQELPGILLWAMIGAMALHKRQHFVQPESVKESIQDLEDLASPVAAFVRDQCTISPELVAGKGELFAAWTAWCKGNGIDHIGTLAEFGRKLKSAFSSQIETGRRDSGGRFYRGLGVNPA
jgi:phage/plasmid-associated DNA primase